ncbi:Gfo/Idh/MocA family oxidoreductase [bacterium]|nr:Gfo/Idh/MocA family oxidoreductase [bacterium]
MQPTRRQFLGSALGAMAAPIIVPGSVFGKDAPSDRLDIACIGGGGRMQHLLRESAGGLKQNIVAFCDVDEGRIAPSRKTAGEGANAAKAYKDFRKLLDAETSVDAVLVGTPDHWHVPICKAAMRAGKHVYCEKPLAHAVAEARELRELTRQSKVVTQTGNQGSASSNMRRSMELIDAGLFGAITEIHIWHPPHGWPSGVDRPAGEDPVPKGLDWDAWIGPAPMRAYKTGIYHPAKWRGWYDFGGGSVADFCCHAYNLPVRALKLDYPTKIEISGKGLGKESFAKSCTVRYHFPARGNRGPVDMIFYTGGDMPPAEAMAGVTETFGNVPRVGALLLGEKGTLSAGLWNSQCYVKMKDEAKFRGAGNHDAAKAVAQSIPRSPGHMREWVDACKGGAKVFSDFDIGGHITEIGMAGVLALRLQRSIEWDGPNMTAKNTPEAAPLIKPQPRAPWRL